MEHRISELYFLLSTIWGIHFIRQTFLTKFFDELFLRTFLTNFFLPIIF